MAIFFAASCISGSLDMKCRIEGVISLLFTLQERADSSLCPTSIFGQGRGLVISVEDALTGM